jgi:Tfp pilus assembly protein PilX
MVMMKIKVGRIKKYQSFRKGLILVLTVISLIILTILGFSILNVAFGVRRQAIVLKNETSAMLAAEAGYERALVWMEQTPDVISALAAAAGGTVTGNKTFTSNDSNYVYSIHINPVSTGSRIVYRIVSNGHCGASSRTVRVLVMQAVTGWDMGMCQVPSGTSSTSPVYFKTGETLDIPIHINKANDDPDVRDIWIDGSPTFLREVEMGESKGSKYPSSIMDLFDSGISFDQPNGKITDEDVIKAKVARFASTAAYIYTPAYPSNWSSWSLPDKTKATPAVQLEFFVDNSGVGKVRITNNCVVQGYTANTWDYRIKANTGGTQYEKYNIYGCHYIPTGQPRDVNLISDTYVTPSYGGPSFGLIYVSGNVVIGSAEENAATIIAGGIPASQLNTVQGNISIVATGNIWIANSLKVYGDRTGDMPADTNPNMISLLSGINTAAGTEGVIKVIDPKIQKTLSAADVKVGATTYATYEPTGLKNSAGLPSRTNDRKVLDPMVVEAGILVGGGGWGAENVDSRKESLTPLTVRGTITERIRGVVGQTKGFRKDYHFDERLLQGYLPEDMRLKGKYIAVPAGWHDYRN